MDESSLYIIHPPHVLLTSAMKALFLKLTPVVMIKIKAVSYTQLQLCIVIEIWSNASTYRPVTLKLYSMSVSISFFFGKRTLLN